jgi:predicted AlkP superfamily phosphohydrolase/phosphomutase
MTHTAIIGLDGATFRLIDEYRESLPTLDRLISDGYSSELLSTQPPITSVAWPAFATGQNPANYGVFDFMDRDLDAMNFYINDVRKKEFDFFWEYLDEDIGIASVPMIPYHANGGFFVQGSLARINSERVTRPPELNDRIPDEYEYHIDWEEDNADILDQTLARIESREQLFCDLVSEYDLPLYFLMFSAIDHIQHHFWAYEDEDHPGYTDSEFSDTMRKVYERVDTALERILHALPNDTNVILASDHGFCRRSVDVNINAVLQQEEYLTYSDDSGTKAANTLHTIKDIINNSPLYRLVPEQVKQTAKSQLPSRNDLDNVIEWPETRAYSFGAGGNVYLNVAGREAAGTVPISAYEQAREEIATCFESLREDRAGERVIRNIRFKEEVYSGTDIERAPDILLEPTEGYYLTAKFGSTIFSERTNPMPNSGQHEPEGIFVASGPDVRSTERGDPHHITDVAPTIFRLHGYDVPETMDGTPMSECLRTDVDDNSKRPHKSESQRIRNQVISLKQLGRI